VSDNSSLHQKFSGAFRLGFAYRFSSTFKVGIAYGYQRKFKVAQLIDSSEAYDYYSSTSSVSGGIEYNFHYRQFPD